MRLDYKKRFLIFSVILFLSIGCVIGTKKNSLLGGVYFTDEGGYEIQQVNGYTFTEFSGGFEMVLPDSSPMVGPGFPVYGGLIDQERTNEELWKFITQEEFKIFQFEESENRKIDDIPGLLGGFQGMQENQKINGKIFVAMVDNNQHFVMLGFAPKDEWEKFEPIYNKVLKTVKFYVPNRSLKFENNYKREINENEFREKPLSGASIEVAPKY